VSTHKLKERASIGEATIIGVDLAKNVFQVHGAAGGRVRSVPQEAVTAAVAMEACASAHHWARKMARHGHEVQLIAPHAAALATIARINTPTIARSG
jgi:transposase